MDVRYLITPKGNCHASQQGDISINPAGTSELTQGIYKFKLVNFFVLSFFNFFIDHTNVAGQDNSNIFSKL
jgi:hypothetical protein